MFFAPHLLTSAFHRFSAIAVKVGLQLNTACYRALPIAETIARPHAANKGAYPGNPAAYWTFTSGGYRPKSAWRTSNQD